MLRARLLGALEVELDGAAIDSPAGHRPWAVFAYLALARSPVPRGELASRFWPDVLDQSARASLRSALWVLRRTLGEALLVDGDRIGLNAAGGVWVDVHEFDNLADRGPEQALALCHGELLEGIEDDWAISARDRYRERVIDVLEQLARRAGARGDVREAVELTRRQVERDPFDESAHRRLISRLGDGGDHAAAVRTYQALSERLRRELGVAPSPLTRELIDELRADPRPSPGPPALPLPGSRPPLVGRERELARLERAWEGVTAARGGAALIRGEAGIGKSRLTSELRERVQGSGALTASCAPLDLGGAAPLSMWAELLRDLLPSVPAPPIDAGWPGDLCVLVSELPPHFGATVSSVPVAPDLQRTRLFEAVVALLGWAAAQTPVLLVLEDAHAADPPSLELAAYAARRMSSLPVMMLLTRRRLSDSPDADRLEHALRARGLLVCDLELEPMAPEGVEALARSVARLGDGEVGRVVERAEGNALLAVETAHALARGQGDLAASLRGSVRATLAPLSGDARALVELAAVAGRSLAPIEIDQLSLDDVAEAATRALQTELLTVSGQAIGFRHGLLREAVHAEIAEPRRRALHLRWARALLASEQAGAIARPAEVARQLQLAHADADAVPQLIRAAASARSVAALGQAGGYLEEALAIAPEQPELWLELGELEAWRLHRAQSEAAFERALALLDDAEPLARARGWLRRARANHGLICVPQVVLDSARNALELLELTDAPAQAERSEALAACSWAEAVAGSVDQAEALLARLSAGELTGDDLRTYDVAHARALALMRRGRFVESYAPSIAAGEAIARAGRPDLSYGCWANAASAALAAGESERALEFLDRGMGAIAQKALQSLEVHLLAARSFALRGLGRLLEAREAAEAEQRLAEQLAQPELLAMASNDRGFTALECGDFALAAGLLADSLVEGAPISRPLTRLGVAEALARSGRPDAAAAELRATVVEPVRPSDFPSALVPRLARVQGHIALARGDREEARGRLQEAISGWERLIARGIRAESITTVLADLGRPVVGLVEPERELARARAELLQVRSSTDQGRAHAIVP